MTTQTEALKLARQLLWRYRHETPTGNQPYMICHQADEAFERIDEALAQPEQAVVNMGMPVEKLYVPPQPEQEPAAWVTKEQLLQEWLPRLWDALKDVRNKENASAEETLYELYVEMKQQTIAEKIDTMSEITLEDKLSVLASDLLIAQKRVAELELVICQRDFLEKNK